LLEESVPPAGVTWHTPSDERLSAIGSEHWILLHGTLDKKSLRERLTWSEARVPRHLAYPYVPEDGNLLPDRMALAGQDYGRGGIVVRTRLVDVVPVEKQGGSGQ